MRPRKINLIRGCLSEAKDDADGKKQPRQRLPFSNGKGNASKKKTTSSEVAFQKQRMMRTGKNNLVRGSLSITATGKAMGNKQPRQRLPFNNNKG